MARWIGRLAAVLAAAAAPPAAAEFALHESRSRYRLDGTDLRALREQIERGPPRRDESELSSHGLTRAVLVTRFETEALETGGCRLVRLRVSLAIDTLLPEWRPRRAPAAALAREMERTIAALARHEAGHRQQALRTAAEVDDGLHALPPAADCDTLQQAAQRVVSRALMRLRVREFNYDRATQHGRRQGTELDAARAQRDRRSASRR